jgi:hypothetical protein
MCQAVALITPPSPAITAPSAYLGGVYKQGPTAPTRLTFGPIDGGQRGFRAERFQSEGVA